MNKYYKSLTLFISLLALVPASANTKLHLKRYFKCFSHFVRDVPDLKNDPRAVRIKSGALSGVDACMELFDQAKLDPSSGTLSTGADVLAAKKQAFANSLHKITNQRCIGCHGDSSTRPKHGANSIDLAYQAIQDNTLVDFSNLEASTIYTKVKNGHRCWSGNCDSDSSAILASLIKWKTDEGLISREDLYSDPSGYNILGKKILKTFNDFHRTWFDVFKIEEQLSCAEGSPEVYDGGEMAYYATRSLFTDKNFSEIAKADTSLEAVRYSPYVRSNLLMIDTRYTIKLIEGQPKRDGGGDLLPDADRYDTWDPPKVQLGEIVGVKERAPHMWIPSFNHSGYLNAAFNIFKNQGAGAVTSVPYFMMNTEFTSGSKAYGAIKVHRRWSRAVFNDLLCRDFPVVRKMDAIKYVDQSGSSPLAFRGGSSCMQCHSSMDQLARVSRGITRNRSANACNRVKYGSPIDVIHNNTPSVGDHPTEWSNWIDEKDDDFSKRPQKGKFYFRTSSGELVDKSFEGFDELGDVLASQDDLYRCATRRYVKFLTGIDIPMFDPGESTSPKLNKADKYYQKLIFELAKKLKENQDQRELIKAIISSDEYMNPGEVRVNE